MKNYADAVEKRVKTLSRAACIVGGWILVLLSALICVEVVLRKVFSHSLQGVDEIGGYVLAITAAFGFAYTFYENSHIRIDVLIRLMPRKIQYVSTSIALISLLFVAAIFAQHSLLLAMESWEFGSFANTPLRTPLYIPQFIWAAGWMLFVLAISLRLLVVIESFIRGQKSKVADVLADEHDESEGVMAIENDSSTKTLVVQR